MQSTKLYCFLLGLLWSTVAFGGDETYVNSLKGAAIEVGSDLTVQDAWHSYMFNYPGNWRNRSTSLPLETPYDNSKYFTNLSINGYVSLRWEGSEDIAFSSDWFYKVEVELLSWDAAGNALPTATRTLSIDYRVGRQQEFKDWDVFHIPNANKIKVNIQQIQHSSDGVNYNTIPKIGEEDIYLESKILVERVFTLNVAQNFYFQIVGSPNSVDRTITHSWAHVDGAEEYDFEWLFISDKLGTNPSTGSPYTYADVLDWDNASRVSLNHNQYTLELPYEAGRIFFRVRAVGYGNPLKARLTTGWMTTNHLDINTGQIIEPLAADKNWTYSINYAEQGKRVESLTLADGTGRGRQAITKDNSNNRAIVSETIFDREGRQAIQLIPSVAPSTANQLKFHQNYNLNGAGTAPIYWTDFDQNVHYDNLPNFITLDDNSGASQYFSNNNPDLVGSSLADFIPDAKGMPYTRTVFDNQGRVSRQTGIGKKHSLGNGHDTRYFYSAAFQEDLDELFGSEIGYAEHYKMQMVIDPNGQRSINYTNLSNQTVATALIGEAPREAGADLVDELDPTGYNYATSGRVKTRDLTPYNELEKEDNSASWVVRKEFMVASEGDYDFTYMPFIGVYDQCFSTQDGACEFELKINIYDKQGNNVTNSISNISLLTAGTPTPSYLGDFFDISNNDRLSFTFAANSADIGAYTIVKELRLKNVASKVDNFFYHLLQYKELYEDYLAQYYEDFQYNLLNPTTPRTLPSPPSHPYADCIDFAAYVQGAGSWLNPCFTQTGTTITQNYCTSLKGTLKQDLLPGGQYFENQANSNAGMSNQWLTDEVVDLAANPVTTADNITYNDWNQIKGLSYPEIAAFMEENDFFEEHPEWCIYADRCLDQNGNEPAGLSWYEELLQQDATWMTMDLAAAQAAGYLTIPLDPINSTSDFCAATTTGPNGPANTSYSMLTEILNLLPNTISNSYETKLRDKMCNYLSYDDGMNITYYDIATLAQLPGTPASANPISDQRKWEMVRGMMMEAKKAALDLHTSNVSNCNYLQDVDDTDDQFIDANNFEIRVPSYEQVKTQAENNTGLTTTTVDASGGVDQTQFNNHVNSVWQDNALCDFYEASIIYDCIDVEAGTNGINIGFYINFELDPSLQTTYGNNLSLYVSPEDFSLCQPYQIDVIQQAINTAIAGFPTPLRDDLEVIVRPVNNNNPNNTGSIELVLRLPGTEYTSSGLNQVTDYQYVRLQIERTIRGNPSHTGFAPVVYVDCQSGQDYTTCVCEEIKSFESYYQDLIANDPSISIDVYTAIANRYNNDLNLTSPDLVAATDVKYIMQGYCGYTGLGASFSDFALPPSSTATTNLPVAAYPIGGATDYNQWKTIFRADPNIPSKLRTELVKCLDINTGISCQEQALALAIFQASERLDAAAKQRKEAFKQILLNNCMTEPMENFKMVYQDNTLHYTLYYYDASGNLEKTVPPTGVTLLATAQEFQDARLERKNNTGNLVEPQHRLTTSYQYNTLNNVTESTAPDRGTVATYYDKLGRVILTQNAQQKVDGQANYVIYDALGRTTETGVVTENSANLSFDSYRNSVNFQTDLDQGLFPNSLVSNQAWTKKEVRTTMYSTRIMEPLFETSSNLLRNRVGTQTYSMNGDPNQLDYAVSYNYDIFGNAQEIWQRYPHLLGNPYKQLKYDYDLISGVVHRVDYQEGEKDQLSFKYTYDANNRLIKTKSTTNGFIWNTDAHYEYYLHGPLKRVELGEDKVQAMDYVYTLHGWIKGVNSNQLQTALDPGKDGNNTNYIGVHDRVAKDVFGYAVHYYDGDFTAINSTVQNFSQNPTGTGNLYNGNISSVTQAQTKPAIGGAPQQALPSIWKRYRYDLLHRVTQAQTAEVAVGTSWSTGNWTGTTAFQTDYSYGPNGNILSLDRYGSSTTAPIDQLTYTYTGTTTPSSLPTQFAKNQLLRVQDAAGSSTQHDDINTQPSFGSGNNDQNYRYDLNGSLITDHSEEIQTIEWTSENKVASVQRTSGSTRDDLRYVYDFQGNRISKIETPKISTQKERHHIYVRDPQGNVLAIYEYQKKKGLVSAAPLQLPPVMLTEQIIYGSDRLATLKRNVQTGGMVHVLGNGLSPVEGVLTPEVAVNGYLEHTESYPDLSYTDYIADRDSLVDTTKVLNFELLAKVANEELLQENSTIFETTDAVVQRLERIRGIYRYELKNFRGDVRQVITDVKTPVDTDGDHLANYYSANVIQSSDSYPFGWDIKERSFSVDNYRFGFNGKENDKEWGNQLIQDYGFRLYNPAIGKFLSVDPLAPDFPELTTYQFASNTPIRAIDLDGLEAVDAIDPNFNQTVQVMRTQDVLEITHSYTHPLTGKQSNLTINFNLDGVGRNEGASVPGRVMSLKQLRNKYGRYTINAGGSIAATLNATPGVFQVATGWFLPPTLEPTLNDAIRTARVDAGRTGAGARAGDIQNSFHHFVWQIVTQAMLGEDVAQEMGFYHEREKFEARQGNNALMIDMVTDLLNNEYARNYAKENNISLGTILNSDEDFADFLNGTVRHLMSSIPEYANDNSLDNIRTGKTNVFTPDNEAVQHIRSKLSRINIIHKANTADGEVKGY